VKEEIIARGASSQEKREKGGKNQIPSFRQAWDLVYVGKKMQR
jgi:hypothetical protein